MPHMVFKGKGNFTKVHRSFQQHRVDENGWILKLRNCYLSTDAESLLFEVTAVRSGFSQDFHLRVEQKSESFTVRLDPYMRIERNEGVQRAIQAVATLLLQHEPGLVLERTNLPADVLKHGAWSAVS